MFEPMSDKNRLIKEASDMIMKVFLFDAPRKVGAWIEKHGKHFPLKEFKSEHFNHRIK